MNNLDIETKLSAAVSHAVPDVLDNILSLCDNKGECIMLTQATNNKPKNMKKAILGIAAAFAIMTGISGFSLYNAGYINGFTVDIDVNPSIELKVNHSERIVAATALNPDAEKILEGMNLKNTDMNVAVNAIMGSMLENGYIDELANSVLITVEGANTEKGNALCQKLTEEVQSTLQAQSVNAAVLSQTMSARDGKALKEQAATSNISVGRTELINQLIAQNSNLKFEDLAKLTVNELNILANNNTTALPNVNSTGKPSEKDYIGQDKAMQLALAHLNLTPEQAANAHFSL
ncbi:MAG: cell wall protein, partial [Oscillospiraceae bacterium]